MLVGGKEPEAFYDTIFLIFFSDLQPVFLAGLTFNFGDSGLVTYRLHIWKIFCTIGAAHYASGNKLLYFKHVWCTYAKHILMVGIVHILMVHFGHPPLFFFEKKKSLFTRLVQE